MTSTIHRFRLFVIKFAMHRKCSVSSDSCVLIVTSDFRLQEPFAWY